MVDAKTSQKFLRHSQRRRGRLEAAGVGVWVRHLFLFLFLGLQEDQD
jgi:hypothetical protein